MLKIERLESQIILKALGQRV